MGISASENERKPDSLDLSQFQFRKRQKHAHEAEYLGPLPTSRLCTRCFERLVSLRYIVIQAQAEGVLNPSCHDPGKLRGELGAD